MFQSVHRNAFALLPVLCAEYVSVCNGQIIFCRLLSGKRVMCIIGARRRVINGEYIYIRRRR